MNKRRQRQIEALHGIGIEMGGYSSREAVYGAVVEAAESILDIDLCLVGIVPEDRLRVVAKSEALPEDGYHEPVIASDEAGLVGRSYRRQESILREGEDHPDANPQDDYQSSFTVPIGAYGVFQAVSYDVVAFDETDVELVEILTGHGREALQRLEHQEQLRQQEQRVKRLHEVGMELASCNSEHEVYDLVVEAADRILDLDICYIGVVMEGVLRSVATTDSLSTDGYHEPEIEDEEAGLAGRSYRQNESILASNIPEHPDANPQDEYRSIISVPLKGIGVFQAGSYQQDAFDQTDLELVELLTEHARDALQRLEYETELKEQRQELDLLRQVFSRVFRHNVRNELTAIRGNAEMISTASGEDPIVEQAAIILESTEQLINHTEKAQEVEEIVQKGQEKQRCSLGDIVTAVVKEYDSAYPNAELTQRVDDADICAVPDIEKAISNAVENALDHNDESVEVTISSKLHADDVSIIIEDTGSGIPKSERRVINDEEESALSHCSGVGLWLMKWLIEKSDGSIAMINTDTGAHVEMRLPRARDTE